MKNKLRDYFFDRLSSREEEDVQRIICANKGSQELDDALRGLFDECLASLDQHTRRQSTVRKLIPYFVAAAAALALLIVIPLSYKAGLNTGEERIASIGWVEVSVPFGKKETVTLSDGTVLHLNSGSRLTYPSVFSGDSRIVFMDGEAYLDIARFNPNGYKAFYEDNSLHFLDMEMADIAVELSRRFNCEIVVLDEELASRRYFSIFTNNETLDQILAVMSSDGKMRVRNSGKTIYLQSN